MILLADTPLDTALWKISVGGVCAASCALLGCFLILRRLSLMGDAISHGVLPGIAAAVILTGKLSGPLHLLLAVLFGFLTAFLAQTLHSRARVTEDSSLGVVFTSLFAVGVILMTTFLRHVDVDPQCIFFGELDAAVTHRESWLGVEVPEAFPTQMGAFLICLAFVCLVWKELKLATFDPGLASAMGFRPLLLYYLLIVLVSGTTVSAFEAVGSILVVAMLVVPPATALLLTDRLAPLVAWAVGLAVSATALAVWFSSLLGTNTPGMIAVVSGGQFLLVVLFAPRHGVLARAARRLRLSIRVAMEEVLASLYRRAEGAPTSLEQELRTHGIAGWMAGLVFWRLRRGGWIESRADGEYALTPAGQAWAEEVVRSHRLWEAFLDKNFDLPPDHLHAPASRVEHYIGPQLRGEIARELAQPQIDPHGRAIPGEEASTKEARP